MPQSQQLVISILTFLASTTGSGGVTTWLFDWLKATWPMHDGAIWLVRWMHTPRYARLLSVFLAMAISIICTALLALITGANIWNALDLVVAPAFSAIFSQVLHARQLPGTPTYPEPTINNQPLTSWATHKPPELLPGYSAEDAQADYQRDIAEAAERYQQTMRQIQQSSTTTHEGED